MGVYVTFNPIDYLIEVTKVPVAGASSLDFKIDIYSDGKEDWRTTDALAKHTFPIRAVGGDPLPGSLTLDPTYFILPPWRILPYDVDHELTISGNVFREDGLPISAPRAGRSITLRVASTFSAGASPSDIADAVHGDGRALTVGKFIALK